MKITFARVTNWKSLEDSGRLDLADINVIVGRNNTGKSAFLRALNLIQQGSSRQRSDIRLGHQHADIYLGLSGDDLASDFSRHFSNRFESGPYSSAGLEIQFSQTTSDSISVSPTLKLAHNQFGVSQIPATEPNNFIYPYLSKRKVTSFEQGVDRQRTLAVVNNLQFLVAKVDRLSDPDYVAAAEYDELCKKVLGFRISTYASESGHQAGISIGRFDHIPIEDMGEGVSSQLGLITDLCMADGNLFLIEELENDVHPEGLKALLDVVIEKSATNQFVITTHSNIVARHLGAAHNSKIFRTESRFEPSITPVSTIAPVQNTSPARIAVLRELGYELHDFELWEGWLILEEASAEVIIRDYLVRWFAPKLTRVRTIGARGTSRVQPIFDDFWRLFLFTHLEEPYKGRAWVVADGDKAGIEVIEQLRRTYSRDWPADHFRNWSKPEFEQYYPKRFANAVEAIAKLHHDKKPGPKKKLMDEVAAWCDSDPASAKAEFESSALEVIAFLREVEGRLFGER